MNQIGPTVVFLGLVLMPGVVQAAPSTTCVCRTADGKSFRELTLRHHRWACDYHFHHVLDEKGKADQDAAKKDDVPFKMRPSTETCNSEEVTQFKVWLCMESRCTYPYSRSAAGENGSLRSIETFKGKRRP
jgi:hypothetical protein